MAHCAIVRAATAGVLYGFSRLSDVAAALLVSWHSRHEASRFANPELGLNAPTTMENWTSASDITFVVQRSNISMTRRSPHVGYKIDQLRTNHAGLDFTLP